MLSSPWKHLKTILTLLSILRCSHRMELLHVSPCTVICIYIMYFQRIYVRNSTCWVHVRTNILRLELMKMCKLDYMPSFSTLPQYFPFHAQDGFDYEGKRFTVTFPAGVNVISFNVTIIDDNIAELAELFTLNLVIPAAAAAMGVRMGETANATVNIMDDEG